jgi:hypothetical protein
MWTSSIEDIDSDTRLVRVCRHGAPATYRAVVDALRSDAAFRDHLLETLASAPGTAFFWEARPVSASSLDTAFEFVTVASRLLAGTRADPTAFHEHLATAGINQAAAVFPSLRGDATLVVPTQQAAPDVYGHLAAFVRGAPAPQRQQFLQAVGTALAQRISAAPTWLSTAGLGVAWLHVRLDSTPKYYSYRAFREYQASRRADH